MAPMVEMLANGSLLELARTAASGTDERLCASPLYARLARLPPGRENPARALLQELLQANRPRIEQLNYPESVRKLVAKEFVRMEGAVEQQGDAYFDIASHAFRSDLRIAQFGRVPVGPEHLDVDGVPRSVLVRGGLGQALRFARLWSRAGGVRPFYVLHLAHGIPPQAFLFAYSAQAQRDMFLRLAECLKMHPEVRGALASSWWHDPQLTEVSPHLRHLRAGWLEHGAELFRWESSPYVTQLATANSPPRKQFVEEGRYTPVSHMVVWLRASLISWAAGEAK